MMAIVPEAEDEYEDGVLADVELRRSVRHSTTAIHYKRVVHFDSR